MGLMTISLLQHRTRHSPFRPSSYSVGVTKYKSLSVTSCRIERNRRMMTTTTTRLIRVKTQTDRQTGAYGSVGSSFEFLSFFSLTQFLALLCSALINY